MPEPDFDEAPAAFRTEIVNAVHHFVSVQRWALLAGRFFIIAVLQAERGCDFAQNLDSLDNVNSSNTDDIRARSGRGSGWRANGSRNDAPGLPLIYAFVDGETETATKVVSISNVRNRQRSASPSPPPPTAPSALRCPRMPLSWPDHHRRRPMIEAAVLDRLRAVRRPNRSRHPSAP